MSTSSTLLGSSLFGLLVVTALAGCATGTDGVPAGTDEADVTALKYYDCRGSSDNGDTLVRMEVGFGARKIAITDISKDAAAPDTGTLDPDYHPTSSTYEGAIRFGGFSTIMESLSDDVADLSVIVSKELQARETTGKIWIRTSGSGGGDTSQYFCRSKPSALKVDADKKARLACSLSHLICTDDNPPGSTCLADLFVNQTTADAATLKLTYLDHFGVNVVVRPEALGASNALTRTATGVKASWVDGTNDLKLEYRGGITYTGTFKLPDGRSESVQCNDLAMLD